MSKAEAQKHARSILGLADATTNGNVERLTTGQFLRHWLRVHKAVWAANTYERYKSIVELHLIPNIGDVPLASIRPLHAQRLTTLAIANNLQPQSCLHIFRAMHAALNYAVKTEGFLLQNPFNNVRAPRVVRNHSRLIDADVIRRIIKASKGTALEIPITISAVTGLRRGELLALRWSNVDLDNGFLQIVEALEQTREYGVRFKEPKARASYRRIPIAPETVELLRRHKSLQERRKHSLRFYDDNDLVISALNGKPIPPDTLSAQVATYIRRLGYDGVTLHHLRHGFASLLIGGGASIKEVQSLLGHSTPMTTLNIYTHAVAGVAQDAVSTLTSSILATRHDEGTFPNVPKETFGNRGTTELR